MHLEAPARTSLWLACLAISLTGAAAASPTVLIFGEQHDQPDQQRQVASSVQQLAADARLGALVLEMAEAPHSSAGLPRDASDAQVRDALQWKGWPWEPYAGVVMNAVRAGVPVLGGNLPRSRMREAMTDSRLDASIGDDAREAIAEAVRNGHCGLLPAAQEPGMVRIQIARDQSMAQTVESSLRSAPPGTLVMLLAGAHHASRDRGVPVHLQRAAQLKPADIRVVIFGDGPTGLQVDEQRPAVFTPQPDPCEALRKRLAAAPDAAAASAASAASAPAR